MQSAISQKTAISMCTAVHNGFLAETVEYIFTFLEVLLKKLIIYDHYNIEFSVCETGVCVLSLLVRKLIVIKCFKL